MTAVDIDPYLDTPRPEREQPSDLPAERAIIGTAMVYPEAMEEVTATGITADDFYLPAHAAAWLAIDRLANHGAPYDWPSVLGAMTRDGSVHALPHQAYLSEVTDLANRGSASHHARTVCEMAAKRRAIVAGNRILRVAWSPATDAAEVQATAESAVAEIAAPSDDSTWSTIDDVMASVRERYYRTRDRGAPEGITWGYADVDRVMTPMQPGDLAVVIAWAGGGKSVVAANLALDAAVEQGKRALVHAMEMTRLELGQRYAAKTGKIRLDQIIKGTLKPDQEDHLDWAIDRVNGAPLVIDQSETVTLSKLRASIRRHKPDLVIVDQLPIMIPEDTRANREQQMSGLAYGLKRMASAEKVVVVACAQLNSAPMQRSDKRPTMQDIRESRAIGQAANIAVLLHDPTVLEKESPRAGEIDWIIDKQRQGPKDVVVLAQQFHFSRLADLAT